MHKALPSTTLYYKACRKHFPVLLCTTKLAESTSQYYFVLQGLHKVLPSTTLYYKACTKHFPVLLCTTKVAKSTSQYFFVPQSLHTVFPSTNLYYKACTQYFPVLLCTTKLAQSTSLYYCVLQRLPKVFPSTTLYCKACTTYFPALLCTTKVAQSISQYYFVLRSLRKALPSTTLYYKPCTKYVPVLLCDTKLAQRKFFVLVRICFDGISLILYSTKTFWLKWDFLFCWLYFSFSMLGVQCFFQQRFRLYSWVSAVLALAFISRCHFSLIPSTITGPGGTFEPLQLTVPCTPLWGQPRPGGNLCTAIHYTFKCPTCHMWSINFSCCHLTKIYTRF